MVLLSLVLFLKAPCTDLRALMPSVGLALNVGGSSISMVQLTVPRPKIFPAAQHCMVRTVQMRTLTGHAPKQP